MYVAVQAISTDVIEEFICCYITKCCKWEYGNFSAFVPPLVKMVALRLSYRSTTTISAPPPPPPYLWFCRHDARQVSGLLAYLLTDTVLSTSCQIQQPRLYDWSNVTCTVRYDHTGGGCARCVGRLSAINMVNRCHHCRLSIFSHPTLKPPDQDIKCE